MATSALPPPRTFRVDWTRFVALVPVAVVLAVSLIELLLADRKFGLFTGGFGMSRAVDTLPERALFLAGYASEQALLGVAGWALVARLIRGRPGWAAAFVFARTNGALLLGVLAAQYQLAAYFSDAMSSALLKQLGGGSL